MKNIRKTLGALLAATMLLTVAVLATSSSPAAAGDGCDGKAGPIFWRPEPCDTTKSGSTSNICFGGTRSNINDAKLSYKQQCGMTWQWDSGLHRCDWYSHAGWLCYGPGAK